MVPLRTAGKLMISLWRLSKVVRLYSLQHEFAISDQVLFDMPLHIRLHTTVSSHKHLINLVSQYHSSTRARKGSGQTLVTKYFTRNHRRADLVVNINNPHSEEEPPNIV